MGTNYYAEIGGHRCSECDELHGHKSLHIGKSSAGWCFTMASYREPWDEGPVTWDDWKALLDDATVVIRDEYGEVVSFTDFVGTVTERRHPRGLRRHDIGNGHCYAHGEGTWDYCKPGFS